MWYVCVGREREGEGRRERERESEREGGGGKNELVLLEVCIWIVVYRGVGNLRHSDTGPDSHVTPVARSCSCTALQ